MMVEASGILIRNKVVKPEMFYALGAVGAIDTWEKFKAVIQGWRAAYPNLMSNAEFFIQEMQKIKTQNEARFNDTLKPAYRAP
jgi:hypothetical protein